MGSALDAALPFLKNKTVRGIFLGDEPCCTGVPAWALDAAASFTKERIGDHGIVYVNECSRPFDPRLHYHGSFVNPVKGGNSSGSFPGVPKSLDLISLDMYCPNHPCRSPQVAPCNRTIS